MGLASELDGLQVTRPSLEDIYLSLTEAPSDDSSGSRPIPDGKGRTS